MNECKCPQRWNTRDELRFLKGLGGWRAGIGPSRARLLANYLESMEKRKRWNGLNQEKIREYILAELDKLTGKNNNGIVVKIR